MDVPLGEWSKTYFATDHIQTICDQVIRNVEEKTGRVYDKYKAVFYRVKNLLVQHYIFKVYVGDDYLHLWVTDACGSTGYLNIEVLGVQQNHKWNDLLEPFDHNN
ncbi:cystatin-B-like [Girardinichthys multiradiatus]|uniref:cystatin-B-like n=1 Tax=Girardinichthys multiradiatus TaxID=208333 RepID=UPI001FACFABE|nr:cystatin-B-like [Girardinichthys multiradiatus]XP_047206177.1 cystatin-B-like [Girardinichthys multiradiatus]XP_047206179.1 cystatin-B-like [Girardinichthys multiradiatus]